MKKVLILGGNGFIGKNLAKNLLAHGECVKSFDIVLPECPLEDIEYVQGSFFEEGKLADAMRDVDVVFHAVSSITPSTSNEKYMQGYSGDFIHTVKLCNLIKETHKKMIFLSSGGTIYGDQSEQPIKENASSHPINHYGNVKLCIENTIRVFNQQSGTNIRIARIANPYGIGQDFKKGGVGFIDAVLKRGINNSVVEVYGDGEIIRDYIFIGDVCEMLYSLMYYEGDEEIFNLSSGIGTSQNEIIKYVSSWIPDLKVRYLEARAIDVKKIVLDNTKICEICNISPLKVFDGMYIYYQYLKGLKE